MPCPAHWTLARPLTNQRTCPLPAAAPRGAELQLGRKLSFEDGAEGGAAAQQHVHAPLPTDASADGFAHVELTGLAPLKMYASHSAHNA